MDNDLNPFTKDEIFEAFHLPKSFAKHLLTIYSLAVGLNAKTILDLGIGSTTRALRMAAAETNGIVWSCDRDVKRFSYLLENQDDNWKLFLQPSEDFIKNVTAPIDFVVHDAAHDYYQVKMDLELILPKMRTFGLICIHDAQQIDLGHNILAAVEHATRGWEISMTVFPFNAGLAILRVEKGKFPNIIPAGKNLDDGRYDTELTSCPMICKEKNKFVDSDKSFIRWVRWRLRKLVKGY